MNVFYTLPLALVLLNLVACGAGSTAGDLSVNDLSIIAPENNNTEPDNANTKQNASITLSWTPPTENTDMTGLNNLAGYKIYFGTSPDKLSVLAEVDAGLSDYVIENDQRIQTGVTYYFGITAITYAKTESSMSNIVSKGL